MAVVPQSSIGTRIPGDHPGRVGACRCEATGWRRGSLLTSTRHGCDGGLLPLSRSMCYESLSRPEWARETRMTKRRKRHTPEQIVEKLRQADALLGAGQITLRVRSKRRRLGLLLGAQSATLISLGPLTAIDD